MVVDGIQEGIKITKKDSVRAAIVAVGDNYDGQCNVTDWKIIKIPNK